MQFFDKTFWLGASLTAAVAAVFYWAVPSAGIAAAIAFIVLAVGLHIIGLKGREPGAKRGAWRDRADEKRLLIEEFRSLLHNCAWQSSSQFEVVRDEISQVQSLLNDAIDNLSESFHGMHAKTEEQRKQMLAVTADEVRDLSERTAAVNAIGESSSTVETFVNRAVIALQFQDLVTQLLAHIGRRVDALDGVMRTLETLGTTLEQEAAADDAMGAIASLRAEQANIMTALDSLETKTNNSPVGQKAMAGGGIELF